VHPRMKQGRDTRRACLTVRSRIKGSGTKEKKKKSSLFRGEKKCNASGPKKRWKAGNENGEQANTTGQQDSCCLEVQGKEKCYRRN